MRHMLLIGLLFAESILACGPSPQKVVKQVTVRATPESVWAVVGNVAGMQKWHPDIKASQINTKQKITYRTLTLTNGGELVERIRPIPLGEMKVGAVIEAGDLAVSSYSDALTVKPGITAGTAIVTWTGRFNNKANLLVAPEGEDNQAAIAAVTALYTRGLNHLQAMFLQ